MGPVPGFSVVDDDDVSFIVDLIWFCSIPSFVVIHLFFVEV